MERQWQSILMQAICFSLPCRCLKEVHHPHHIGISSHQEESMMIEYYWRTMSWCWIIIIFLRTILPCYNLLLWWEFHTNEKVGGRDLSGGNAQNTSRYHPHSIQTANRTLQLQCWNYSNLMVGFLVKTNTWKRDNFLYIRASRQKSHVCFWFTTRQFSV